MPLFRETPLIGHALTFQQSLRTSFILRSDAQASRTDQRAQTTTESDRIERLAEVDRPPLIADRREDGRGQRYAANVIMRIARSKKYVAPDFHKAI